MPLCGSSRCGCAIVSVPAVSGEVGGYLPTIDVAGNGTPASPWNLTFNADWVTALVAAVDVPTAWTNVSFQNSWTNYGAGQQDVQYRKIRDLVYLRGAMKNASDLWPSVAFTLPVGFRPPAPQGFRPATYFGGYSVQIATNGEVTRADGGNGAIHEFDGIVFSTI